MLMRGRSYSLATDEISYLEKPLVYLMECQFGQSFCCYHSVGLTLSTWYSAAAKCH
ncbi:hypothetical protein FHX10_006502 [Rhizobium sp. BK591]|nr:hypothetical protein [Rhizobium sp. BK591]